MAYPRVQRSRTMKKARRTSGNLTLNSTTWANVDTGLDITLNECQVGDEIIYSMFALVGNEATNLYFDVVTVVAGSPVNSFAQRGAPIAGGVLPGWRAEPNVLTPVSGDVPPYTLVAGDLVDGSVTLRLRYRTSTAADKTLLAAGDHLLDVWAMNIGPAQV